MVVGRVAVKVYTGSRFRQGSSYAVNGGDCNRKIGVCG